MPSNQHWLIDDKVAYVKFWGEVTADEISAEVRESARLRGMSTSPQVHYLHNWGEVTKFPTSLVELNTVFRNRTDHRDRLGWVVAYGTTNRTINMLGDLFFSILRVKFRLFDTEEKAVAFLCRADPSVPEFDVDSALAALHDEAS